MRKFAIVLALFIFSFVIVVGCSKRPAEKIGKLETQEEGVAEEQVVSPPQDAQLYPPSNEKIAPPVLEPAGAPQQPLAQAPAQREVVKLGEGIEWNKKIQEALKNANFYNGAVDGKIGPMTKKAIEEFQKSKKLKVDGKVGSNTWRELEQYLTPSSQPAAR